MKRYWDVLSTILDLEARTGGKIELSIHEMAPGLGQHLRVRAYFPVENWYVQVAIPASTFNSNIPDDNLTGLIVSELRRATRSTMPDELNMKVQR